MTIENIRNNMPTEDDELTTGERKSDKYKSFPEASLGLWGPEVREKHPDELNNAILGRIRHISSRIDSYLPPYSEYHEIQSLATNLENSFDELAQLYLKLAREGYGGYFYPLKEKTLTYPYDSIKVFDEKLEKIQKLIIEAEIPLFEAKNKNDKISTEEETLLREQCIGMLKEAIDKIDDLKKILSSRSPLTA